MLRRVNESDYILTGETILTSCADDCGDHLSKCNLKVMLQDAVSKILHIPVAEKSDGPKTIRLRLYNCLEYTTKLKSSIPRTHTSRLEVRKRIFLSQE